MWKKVAFWSGLFLTLTAIGGLVWNFETRWNQTQPCIANAKEIKLTQLRIEQKIQEDNARNLQQRIWDLEKAYAGQEVPHAVKIEIDKLKIEREAVLRCIDRQLSRGTF